MSVSVASIDAVPPGGTGELAIRIVLAPGYHIMSDRPSKPTYIATALKMTPAPDGVAYDEPIYPEAIAFESGGEPIATFEGTFLIRLPVSVREGAAAGARQLQGVLRYQACTKSYCLFPREEPFAAEITIRE